MMRFKVGEWVYRLVIVEDKIFGDDGKEIVGQAIWDSKEILISAKVPPEQRKEILLHELRHCWEFHCERPRSKEAEANFHAMVAHASHVQLEQQGGNDSLRRLGAVSLPSIAPDSDGLFEGEVDDGFVERYCNVPATVPDEMIEMRADRAYCAKCGHPVTGGSVVMGEPNWDMQARGVVRLLQLYCPICDHVQTTRSGIGVGNDPSGLSIVGAPIYETGRAVNDFLIAHPKAIGECVLAEEFPSI